MEFKPNSSNSSYYNKHPINVQKVSISILVISLPLLYVSLLHLPLSSLFRDTTFWFLISNSIIFIVAADSGMFSSSSSSSSSSSNDLIYDEFIKHSTARRSFFPVQENMQSHDVDQNSNMLTSVILKDDKEELDYESEPHSNCAPVNTVGKKDCSKEDVEEEKQIINVKPKREAKYSRSRTEVVAVHRPKKESDDEVGPASKWVRRSATMVVENRRCGMEESDYWKMSDEELNRRVEDFIKRFNREIRLEAKMTSAVY